MSTDFTATHWLLAILVASSTSSFALEPVSVNASTDDGNVATNTLDGSLDTRWSALGDGQWIEYDLGKSVMLEALQIAFYKGDQRSATLDIQTSTDASNWQSLYSGEQVESSLALQNFDIDDLEAQFVRIIGYGNSANSWNSLTEVTFTTSEISSDDDLNTTPAVLTNLALGKSAEQSSTDYNGQASRAVDGDNNGSWRNGSVSHTASEAQPWWQVDLGSSSDISYIDLYNRSDSCCSARLTNYYIFVSDSPFESSDLNSTLNQAGVTHYYFADEAASPSSIDINQSGRYVRVQLADTNALNIAEVEVYGVISSAEEDDTSPSPAYCESLPALEFDSPYAPTTPEKIAQAFPKFSWDHVPRTMLIRHATAGYSDAEIERMANLYDLIVLEKANGDFDGYHLTANRLKAVNPDIKVLFYWNSRMYYGHNDVDDYILERWDDFIDPDYLIRGYNTYQRENEDFIDWWVGVCTKMMGIEEGYSVSGSPLQPSPLDGCFIDKTGYPTYMAEPMWEATPDDKLIMCNNKTDRERIAYLDGTYQEGWHGGWDLEDTAYGITLAQESGVNQKFTMLRNPPKSRTSARELEDSVTTPLAAYLIYADEYAYFYYQQSVNAKLDDWLWLTDYLDQGNRPLGAPYCHAKQDGYTYVRSFEHADVYFDMTPEGLEYPIPTDTNVSGEGLVNARIMFKNDIGSPALAGSGYSDTDNTYSLKGSGNISGTSDNFFYLSDLHYGDGEFKARIDSIEDTHSDAKAGLMFRERTEPGSSREEVIAAYADGTVLEADARMVAVMLSPAGQMQMLYRSTKGGTMVTAGSGVGPYAKLVRSGDTFTGYASTDGSSWNAIASVSIALDEKVEMGMAVASHNDSKLANALFSEFERYEHSAYIMP